METPVNQCYIYSTVLGAAINLSLKGFSILFLYDVITIFSKFQVCEDQALEDGQWVEVKNCKPHVNLKVDEACKVCDYVPNRQLGWQNQCLHVYPLISPKWIWTRTKIICSGSNIFWTKNNFSPLIFSPCQKLLIFFWYDINKIRQATLSKYLPDFCDYMSHFLLVIANYLFAFFITLWL